MDEYISHITNVYGRLSGEISTFIKYYGDINFENYDLPTEFFARCNEYVTALADDSLKDSMWDPIAAAEIVRAFNIQIIFDESVGNLELIKELTPAALQIVARVPSNAEMFRHTLIDILYDSIFLDVIPLHNLFAILDGAEISAKTIVDTISNIGNHDVDCVLSALKRMLLLDQHYNGEIAKSFKCDSVSLCDVDIYKPSKRTRENNMAKFGEIERQCPYTHKIIK